MRLKDNVAIITGATRGIGAAFAVGFAKEGARIVIGDLADAADTVKRVEEAGSEAIPVKTDVSNEGDCFALVKAAMERFGRIDVLINNAGIFATVVLKPFTELSSEEFKRVVVINTSGTFHCVKAVFPHMKEKGAARSSISHRLQSSKGFPVCPITSRPRVG
jgi:NAD(P)-dependent dehydrogenase (short-subunit alcohol dehydrogenase family)